MEVLFSSSILFRHLGFRRRFRLMHMLAEVLSSRSSKWFLEVVSFVSKQALFLYRPCNSLGFTAVREDVIVVLIQGRYTIVETAETTTVIILHKIVGLYGFTVVREDALTV
jgi:hypothetical protein